MFEEVVDRCFLAPLALVVLPFGPLVPLAPGDAFLFLSNPTISFVLLFCWCCCDLICENFSRESRGFLELSASTCASASWC